MMNEAFVKASSFGDASIYEGGNIGNITLNELVGNEVAIKQLINDRNIKAQKVDELQNEIGTINAELGFQRTSPFFAYISAGFNFLGSIFMCVGGSVVQSSSLGWFSIIGGAILILLANIQTISHKSVYHWFNKKKK